MSDQIDPAFKTAYRETQGQPVDAVGRPDLIERLLFHGRYASETQSECTERKNSERVEASERIAALEDELQAARFAERNGKSLAEDSIHAIRELLKAHDVPVAAFIDDHVGNAIAQRDASRAECEGLRAALEAAKNWLEYDNSPMGEAEEAAYWRLRARIDAALASLQPAKGEREGEQL
jgi:hypothetical protein